MTQGLHFLTEGEGRMEDSDHTASSSVRLGDERML